MDSDSTKTLDELRREIDELKTINEQEERTLRREQRELGEAQGQFAMKRAEQHQLNQQFMEMLTSINATVDSDLKLADMLLNRLLEIKDFLEKPDPALVAKNEELARLTAEMNKFMDAIVNIQQKSIANDGWMHVYLIVMIMIVLLDEDAALKALLREKEAELQRLKDIKENNRMESAQRKKERQEKIDQLLDEYLELHAKVVQKKYAGSDWDSDE